MSKQEHFFALAIDEDSTFERYRNIPKEFVLSLIDELNKGNIDSIYISKKDF